MRDRCAGAAWSRRAPASICAPSPRATSIISACGWTIRSSSAWSGSEFLQAYKHVWDKSPAFFEAVLTDPTQVVLVIEATRGWPKPVGVVAALQHPPAGGVRVSGDDHRRRPRNEQGFGVEAGKLISYYGVDVLGLRRIEAKVYEYNVLSMNSLRRNGFRQEACSARPASTASGTGTWWSSGSSRRRSKRSAKGQVYLPLDASRGNGRELHSLLPLVAFVLNVSLAGMSLCATREPAQPGLRLLRLGHGALELRRLPAAHEPRTSGPPIFVEIVIHIGVIALPAFYYHFVLIFLDSTTRHRPSLVLAYLLAFVYSSSTCPAPPLFMSGVKATYWGWAPATGPLYLPFLLVFNGFLIYGVVLLVPLTRASTPASAATAAR